MKRIAPRLRLREPRPEGGERASNGAANQRVIHDSAEDQKGRDENHGFGIPKKESRLNLKTLRDLHAFRTHSDGPGEDRVDDRRNRGERERSTEAHDARNDGATKKTGR